MIPRRVAEELGQPLPLFIKWDDADYGLRAGSTGYPTVTMPGTAIWYMAWSDQDDAIDCRPISTCATGSWSRRHCTGTPPVRG